MMLAHTLFNWQLPSFEYWIVPGIGLASAGLALFVGGVLFNQRRRPARFPPPALTEEEATDAKDPFVQGSATERRNSLRRRGNPVEVSVAAAEPKEELTRGWVVDRSMGGLCLWLDDAVHPGTILSVRPINAPLGTLWTQIEVRSCRQEAKNWELGCRFLRTPQWSVLLAFG